MVISCFGYKVGNGMDTLADLPCPSTDVVLLGEACSCFYELKTRGIGNQVSDILNCIVGRTDLHVEGDWTGIII
jgi:hypothetical protein